MLRDLLYAFKLFYRSRDGVLFGLLFPLAFAFIYLFALGGLLNGSFDLKPFPIAVVSQGQIGEIRTLLNNGGQEGRLDHDMLVVDDTTKDYFFSYVMVDQSQADQLMKDGVVSHVIKAQSSGDKLNFQMELAPSESKSIHSSILFSYLNSLVAINQAVTLTMSSPNTNSITLIQLPQKVRNIGKAGVYIGSDQSKRTTGISNFFYASLAYICIYFMSMGIFVVIKNEPTSSAMAVRERVSPTKKMYNVSLTFLSILFPSILVVFGAYGIFYMNKVPLGTEVGRTLGLLFLGVLVGISFGMALAAIATFFRLKEGILTGLSIGIPLLLGALSGMMTDFIKRLIVDVAPWINKLNPVALVGDGIYYLNNYPTYQQYNLNLLYLGLMFVVFVVIIILSLRRNDYESL